MGTFEGSGKGEIGEDESNEGETGEDNESETLRQSGRIGSWKSE